MAGADLKLERAKDLSFIEKILMVDFVKGMLITLKNFFRKPITLQYPEQKKVMSDRFRGLHVLTKFDDGSMKCTSCNLCARACPSDCITLTGKKNERTGKGKTVDEFEIDIGKCVFCGFCEEACPHEAIYLSKFYEYTFHGDYNTVYDVPRLEELIPGSKIPTAAVTENKAPVEEVLELCLGKEKARPYIQSLKA